MKHKLPAFDVLVDLARNDPERLETLRKKLTDDIIENAPDDQKRKRLAGLQFRVDMERQRARSPLQATIRISEMMCQSLAELHRSMVTPLIKEPTTKEATVTEPLIKDVSVQQPVIENSPVTRPTVSQPAGANSAKILAFPGACASDMGDTEKH